MSYLQEISRLSERNIGGIIKIQVVRAADVLTFPDPVNGVIYGDITFPAGKGFTTWFATSQSARIFSEDRQSQEGPFKFNKLPFTVAKDKPGVKQQLNRALDDEFIVLFMDANGSTKIFGTPDHPVRFEFSHDSGDAHTARNAYSCQFVAEGPDNVYFYEGNIAAPTSGGSPVILEWYDGATVTTIASAQPGDTIRINSRFVFDDFDINASVL